MGVLFFSQEVELLFEEHLGSAHIRRLLFLLLVLLDPLQIDRDLVAGVLQLDNVVQGRLVLSQLLLYQSLHTDGLPRHVRQLFLNSATQRVEGRPQTWA